MYVKSKAVLILQGNSVVCNLIKQVKSNSIKDGRSYWRY